VGVESLPGAQNGSSLIFLAILFEGSAGFRRCRLSFCLREPIGHLATEDLSFLGREVVDFVKDFVEGHEDKLS